MTGDPGEEGRPAPADHKGEAGSYHSEKKVPGRRCSKAGWWPARRRCRTAARHAHPAGQQRLAAARAAFLAIE
jgi:hypothetical protein